MSTKEKFEKVAEILRDFPQPIFLASFFSGVLLLSFGIGFGLKVLVCTGIPIIIISIVYAIVID